MRLILVTLLLTFPAATAQSQVDTRLSITRADIDSLKFPYQLGELHLWIYANISVDLKDREERIRETTQEYFRYSSLLEELQHEEKILQNLRALYLLALQKSDSSLVDDEAVLKAENTVLSKEIQVIQLKRNIRNSIFALCSLCNIKITPFFETPRITRGKNEGGHE